MTDKASDFSNKNTNGSSQLKKRRSSGHESDELHQTPQKRQKTERDLLASSEKQGYNFRQIIKRKIENNFVYDSNVPSEKLAVKPFIVSFVRSRSMMAGPSETPE
jgi:hypothetical protein